MTVREGKYGFPIMKDIIPEGKSGNCAIEHFTINEQEASMQVMRGIYNREYLAREIYDGEFIRLRVNGGLMMSDTGGERVYSRDIVHNAHGIVLIAGLGIGLILTRIVLKPEVNKVIAVEISPDVITLVEPHIRTYLGEQSNKLEIVQSDIYDYTPTDKLNTVFFDIWANYSGDTYEETKKLHRKFSKYLDHANSPYIESWMRWHMKDLHFGRN